MANIDSLSIQISASTADAKTKIDNLVTSLNSLVSAINSIDSSKIQSLAMATADLSNGIATLKESNIESITKVAEALDTVSSKKEAFAPVVEDAEKLVDTMEKINETAGQNKDGLLGDFDNTAAEEMARNMDRVSDSVEVASHKLSGFKALLSNLKIIVPTEGLDKVNKKITKLEEKIADLKDKLAYNSSHDPDYVNSEEIEKDKAQIQGLINELDRLKLKQQELSAHGGFKLNFNGLSQSLNNVHNKISSLSKKLSGLTSKFHHVSASSKATAKSTDYFKAASDRLVKSLTRVTRMLRLMVLRMALRTVIKEVGNGFKSLALHSEEFDRAMSSLRNSAKTLGYSFSAMVAPLLQAFAPAIVYIINLLTKLMNAINQIFSALSGKGTWNKAKDFTGSWSDDIKAANKEAKELKKTLLGFDEINQLQEKNKAGGGDTSGNIEDMFETMPIESKWQKVADYIKNLAKRLFEPIKKAWEKVGDFVKNSWKYAMDEVLKLGKSIARDFWKVWEQEKTQKIFENILKIIGWIGQTVGNLARQFRKAWDENDTGLHILENIRDIILIITEHFEHMAKATAKWADTLDFSPILTKFNEWLQSLEPVVDALMGVVSDFYETVILPLGKWAVEEGGPQLLQVFIDFNEKVDWDKLRERLKKLWEHLEPFAETVGEGLIIFIDRCAKALADFINSQEFEDFLQAIEDWMDSVTPEDVADGLEAIAKAIVAFAIGKAVIDGLVAISGFLTLIASLAPLLKLAIVIGVAYAGLKLGGLLGKWLTDDDETYDTYTIPVMIEWAIDEFPTSWQDFLDKVKEWVEAWKDLREEAGLFIQLCARFVEGPIVSTLLDVVRLFEGDEEKNISFGGGADADVEAEKWRNAGDAAQEATEKVKEHGSALVNFKSKAEEFKNSMDSTSSVAQKLSEKTSSVASALSDAGDKFSKARTNTQSFGDGAKEASDKTEGLKTSYENMLASVSKVTDATPVLTEKQKSLADALGKTAEKAKSTVQPNDDAKKALDNLKTSTDTYIAVTPTLTKSQQDIMDSLGQLKVETENVELATANSGLEMQATWKETALTTDKENKDMEKSVADSTKEISKSFDEVKKGMTKDKWTFSGVADGLKKTFEDAKNGIKNVWNSIADKLNGDHEIGSGHFRINLPKFALGGFPDENGLFLANSSELVGTFSNGKTAVANNAEIVAGIEAGVYSAVSAALARNGSGNGGYIANTIVVDGEVIARTVTKAQQKQNMRYSPQMG